MKAFQQKLIDYIRKHRLFAPGDRVLLACSGGIDSMVLLHFLNSHRNILGISLAAAHVNHMLRNNESLEDRRFTEQQCNHLEIPCFSRDIPIPELLQAEGGNKQQLCRRERYAFLEETMVLEGFSSVVTAHHADDQLETILMTGMRGTLQTGAFGMAAARPFGIGRLIRPQLAVTKDEILEYASTEGIRYREDSSNEEQIYTRNRVRQTILPLLKKESPAVSGHFVELAEEIREDHQFLKELAEQKLQSLISSEKSGVALSAKGFRNEAPALQKRMVLLLLNYLYNDKQVPITKQLAEQVQELMQRSSGTVFLHLPQDYRMVRQYDDVFFSKDSTKEVECQKAGSITEKWSAPINGFYYKAAPLKRAISEPDAICWYFSSPADPELVFRGREPGDRIQLAGMDQSKKVARLMIDEKVPLEKRADWPVILMERGKILHIPGLRPSKLLSRNIREGDNWVLYERRVKNANSEL
ncbi:MAG TPA: tRNA lysidine(34) synthetase TilS [Planococcus sp. (in: firmicutes)]|nr:tRNA lysidine(34) synthetase TilS [Planococcus sp. (in: firmicutes)]